MSKTVNEYRLSAIAGLVARFNREGHTIDPEMIQAFSALCDDAEMGGPSERFVGLERRVAHIENELSYGARDFTPESNGMKLG